MGGYTEVLVLDLEKSGDGESIVTTPESYRPPDDRTSMFVSWQYNECPSGYTKIREGLLCLEEPHVYKKQVPTELEREADSFYRYSYSAREDRDRLIVFVILPDGYTVHDWAAPNLTDVRSFNNRVVLVWGVIEKDDGKYIGQHIDSINFRLQIKKTSKSVEDKVKRIKRRGVPVELLPWFRLPRFPRDLVLQIGLVAAFATIAGAGVLTGVAGSPLGNILLYVGLGLLVISVLLIGVVRIGDWIQK